jgi:hypothetical protein
MLPTLAERLREQQAKSRGRRPSRPPWPVPGEPPTALLFQVRAEPPSAAVPVGSAVTALRASSAIADSEPLPPVLEAAVTEIATPELRESELLEPSMAPPEPAAPQPPAVAVEAQATVASRPFPERTALAELLLLLVWAVLVVFDGALALASLIDGAAGRRRWPQGSTASPLPPSPPPPFLMAAAAP